MKRVTASGNTLVIAVAAAAFLLVGGFLLLRQVNQPTPNPPREDTSQSVEKMTKDSGFSFSTPKKSPHYESNTPEHGSVLVGVPVNVVINFNFDLAKNSSISITTVGKEHGTGETAIDQNKLAMRRAVNPGAPDGLYTVSYKACWPDGSCHDGNFQFAIDSSQSQQFENLTGKKEVTVSLSNIAFKPMNIIIDKGTKVTWINDDSVEHYVNTDSHPAHTYQLDQNSKVLSIGDSYSHTFTKDGIYPYHCSAHADVMKASILVE